MALGGGLALMGLYHIGPSGFRDAAGAFVHGAENALGGLGHGVTRFAHDVEDTFKEGGKLVKNATYVVLATGMVGTFIYLYRMPTK
jgi:hypothetical protein